MIQDVSQTTWHRRIGGAVGVALALGVITFLQIGPPQTVAHLMVLGWPCVCTWRSNTTNLLSLSACMLGYIGGGCLTGYGFVYLWQKFRSR